MLDSAWLALIIGNSRLHWAWFIGEKLQQAWDTPHLPASVVQQLANCQNLADFPKEILPDNSCKGGFIKDVCSQTDNLRKPAPTNPCLIPLYIASVVPSQTEFWQAYPSVNLITLDKIPLLGVYPTLGSDRALALWGAGETYGYPILVIIPKNS